MLTFPPELFRSARPFDSGSSANLPTARFHPSVQGHSERSTPTFTARLRGFCQTILLQRGKTLRRCHCVLASEKLGIPDAVLSVTSLILTTEVDRHKADDHNDDLVLSVRRCHQGLSQSMRSSAIVPNLQQFLLTPVSCALRWINGLFVTSPE